MPRCMRSDMPTKRRALLVLPDGIQIRRFAQWMSSRRIAKTSDGARRQHSRKRPRDARPVPRPVRDILGQSRLPAMQGTGGFGTLSATTSSSSSSGMKFSGQSFSSQSFSGQSFNSGSSNFGSKSSNVASMVDLTRAGWSNTAGQQRSTLQRVSYGLVDDVLKRSYQTSLDTVQGNKPVVQDLFSGVKAIQLRYLDSNQTWQPEWPPPTLAQPEGLVTRPVAVELIIEFKDWGRIRRIIEVAG